MLFNLGLWSRYSPILYFSGLVIKPGTERNEMERNEMVRSVDSGVVR